MKRSIRLRAKGRPLAQRPDQERQVGFCLAISGHFRDSIGFDERLKKVANALGLNLKRYEDAEQFFLDVAEAAGLSGWRPEECFRLAWLDSIRDGAIEIHAGKRGSRRRIPASPRVLGVLEMRRASATSGWVFPADTRSGHIEASTLKKQHAAALKNSGVSAFVLYTFRHTCITRWAKHMDPFTLHVLAGHTDMNTTKRYVHPSDADILEAMEKVRGGHGIGQNPEAVISDETRGMPAIQ